MTEHEATRRLVKSQPELWAQCSDAASLARHLNGWFGEIRITRLEPESTVAWEGERVSGTVRLEPSGWGTRVTLTARPSVVTPTPAPTPALAPAPADQREATAPGAGADCENSIRMPERTGLLWRLRGALRPRLEPRTLPVANPDDDQAFPDEQPDDQRLPANNPQAALAGALDSLGQAHHRPFSRC